MELLDGTVGSAQDCAQYARARRALRTHAWSGLRLAVDLARAILLELSLLPLADDSLYSVGSARPHGAPRVMFGSSYRGFYMFLSRGSGRKQWRFFSTSLPRTTKKYNQPINANGMPRLVVSLARPSRKEREFCQTAIVELLPRLWQSMFHCQAFADLASYSCFQRSDKRQARHACALL